MRFSLVWDEETNRQKDAQETFGYLKLVEYVVVNVCKNGTIYLGNRHRGSRHTAVRLLIAQQVLTRSQFAIGLMDVRGTEIPLTKMYF